MEDVTGYEKAGEREENVDADETTIGKREVEMIEEYA